VATLFLESRSAEGEFISPNLAAAALPTARTRQHHGLRIDCTVAA